MNILDKIVAVKREEVARLRPQADKLKEAASARKDFRDFAGALRGGFGSSQTAAEHGAAGAAPSNGLALIAEVKKASPSAGVICADFDPVRIAREFEAAGAAALSVLTDERFFQGHVDFLQRIRETVRLPLLRKDFVIDELQIFESVARGSDAILLIVAILDDAQLKGFCELANQMHLAALVEVHDEGELERSLEAGAEIIGINNRDLRDFSVDLATTERLAAMVRSRGWDVYASTGRGNDAAHTKTQGPILVAESGIRTRSDVERVACAGVDAILVGESLMKSGNVAAKAKELMG